MDLTNLIWHLGAALAAIWAALAYRRLNARCDELRQSVLNSVLPLHQHHSSEGAALQQRSLRVRALRWTLEEFRQNHGVGCHVDGQDELVNVEQEQWVRLIGLLIRCSGRVPAQRTPAFCVDAAGGDMDSQDFTRMLIACRAGRKSLTLKWQAAACQGAGGWQCLDI